MSTMKSKNLTLSTALLLAGLAPAVHAAGVEGIAVEVKAGTLGFGVEANYAINPKFTVGLGLNKFTQSTSQTADDIDYDVDLKLQTIALLANYHPFEGTFRITAGLMSNGNELSMKAEPAGTYDIGGTTYSADEIGTLEATVDFKNIAPYLGIGWGKSAGSGFGVTLDIGILFQGAPNLSMDVSGPIADPDSPAYDPQFLADLSEEESNAQDDIKGFTAYPVASLGLNYRF
jgi:hypothetical protein